MVDRISYSILFALGCMQLMAGVNSQPPLWMQIIVVTMVMIPTLIMIIWIEFIQWNTRRSQSQSQSESQSLSFTASPQPFEAVSIEASNESGSKDSYLSSSTAKSRSWSQFCFSFDRNRYVAGAVSILLFTYTGVVQTAFAFLRCVSVESSSIVFSAPIIDCHTDLFRNTAIVAVLVLIVVGLGFPIASIILLTRNRTKLKLDSH